MFYQTVISTLHAWYISYYSIQYILGNTNTLFYLKYLQYSCLYFIIDSFFIIKNKNKIMKQMLLHHWMAIISIYNITYNPNYYHINLISYLLLSEITTIPYNICFLLDKNKLTNTIFFKLNGIAVLILYIPFRLVSFPLILNIVFQDREYLYSTIIGLFTLLNYYWYYLLIKKFITVN